MPLTAKGFTLVELLVILGLLAAIIALTAPALLSFGQGARLNAHAKDLQSLLNNSRSLAMLQQQSVFVCGASPAPADAMSASEPCDVLGEWRHGIHVVLDENSNQAPDIDDSITLFQAPYSHLTTLTWRGFRGKDHIEFLAAGTTNWQNGRFTFCSRDTESEGLEIVLNVAGRSYIRPLTTACES